MVDETHKNIVSNEFNNSGNQSLISKINSFHILCIYDAKTRMDNRNRLKHFTADILQGRNRKVPIFSGISEAETFFVWNDSNQNNRELILKLRSTARNDVIFRLSISLAAHFLQEYSTFIRASITRYPELKNTDFLDTTVMKLEELLRNNTFLAENAVWEKFYSWYKYYVTTQVLKDMEETMGRAVVENLTTHDLNEEFHKQIMTYLQMDSHFMGRFLQDIEYYFQGWIQQIIPSIDISGVSVQHMKTFLELQHIVAHDENHTQIDKQIPLTLVHGDYASVMSNVAYQSIREAFSSKKFELSAYHDWPVTKINRKTVEGTIEIIPYGQREDNRDSSKLRQSWDWVREVSEVDIDTLDALCSLFLSQADHEKDIIEIKWQDILRMRGLKAKLSGNGRRGGFEKEQISQVIRSVVKIQSIWINFSKAVLYEKGKPIQKNLQGRSFIFLDKHHKECDMSSEGLEEGFSMTAGQGFAPYLASFGRQTALFPLKALQYNPVQEEWEKKLIRYFTWRWRTQARKENYQNPYKISSLFRSIGKEINKRTPSRTRERFEQALDKLQEDHLIHNWEYINWDETVAAKNGWSRLWMQTKIIVNPPVEIKEQYRTISENTASKGKRNRLNKQLPAKEYTQLGNQLKRHREKLGLTLVQVAKELDLSPSYISTIENDKKSPSQKVGQVIKDWIKK